MSKKNYFKFILILSLLYVFAYADDAKNNNTEASVCVDCEQSKLPAEEFAKNLDDIMCELVGKGDPAIIKVEADDRNSHYRLHKKPTGEFAIEINPLFYAKKSKEKESLWSYIKRSKSAQKKYTKKMNECFDLYRPFLKGPNGEQLTIRAVSDNEIPKIDISIQESDQRSYSLGYAEDIQCPDILHEVLHLLGLKDEYPEEISGFITNKETGEYEYVSGDAKVIGFDCRAIGNIDSVMYNQDDAILSVLELNQIKSISCICDSNESKKICSDIWESKNQERYILAKTCPKGLSTKISDITTMTPKDRKKYFGHYSEASDSDGPNEINQNPNIFYEMENGKYGFDLLVDTQKSIRLKPIKKSLLMPAHFRMITNPYCYGKNKLYKECTEGAYMNSKVHGQCPKATKKCQSNTDWLQ